MSFSDHIFRNKNKRDAHNKDKGGVECDICFAPSPGPIKGSEAYRCDQCKHDIQTTELTEREAYDNGEIDL